MTAVEPILQENENRFRLQYFEQTKKHTGFIEKYV